MIEHAHDRAIAGFVLAAAGGDPPIVEFRIGDRVVGRAHADAPRAGGGFRFKTLLDMDGEAIVAASRLSDDAPLANSPCMMTAPQPGPPPPAPAWAAAAEIVKPFEMPRRGEVALFLAHARGGALPPHVPPYLAALRAAGIAVLLVAVTDRPLDLPTRVLGMVAGAMVRANLGTDLAARAHAIRLHPELYGAALLYLLDDEVVLATGSDAFAHLLERVRASPADLVGLTESQAERWHLQAYFLAMKPRLLSSQAVQIFMAAVRLHDDEAGYRLAAAMEEAGYRAEALFPGHSPRDPALDDWHALVAEGFPFVKLAACAGDAASRRAPLAAAGFDPVLIDATLATAVRPVASDPDDRLLARPIPRPATPPLSPKVAFFGPWNHESGAGTAARGLVAAIRRTGARLNLHPLRTPPEGHRLLAPSVDVIDFAGLADIAIVLLDPDRWHLLSEAQRTEVAAARRRIGYWTGDPKRIATGYRPGPCNFDRIWAPGRAHAGPLAALGEAPVEIVVPPVPLPILAPPAAVARGNPPGLAGLGLPTGQRIILFAVDDRPGAGRKDPAPLVRAFAATGLARDGWMLVLKARCLPDPAEAALRALADATPGVLAIARTLQAAALADLLALADIYAAPHVHGGSGRMIAEAMAAGKPVVAARQAGDSGLLDATTAYLVATRHSADPGVPDRIDEAALAAALASAAAAVASGDRRIGDAARARVAATLSYAAVARLIARSFSVIMTKPDRAPPFRRIAPTLAAGVPIERAELGHDMRAIALAADGTVPEAVLGLPAGMPEDRVRWLVLAPAGARLHPLFSRIAHEHALERPDVDIFYTDDLAVEADQAIDQLRLKPAFDITLLVAQDYVGAPLIVRADAFARLGGLRREAATAALYDLLLRGHAAGLSIARIDWVLLAHPGVRPKAAVADRLAVLAATPLFEDHDLAPGRAPGTLALRRRFAADKAPPVTIIVPTAQSVMPIGSVSHVERLLAGIARTDWPMDRLTVIVGDDIAAPPGWAAPDGPRWPFALRRVETIRAPDERFNYAAKMNRLWRLAESEHIVFLNDDVRPVEPGWLKALMTFAVDPAVGGVGARLLYEDGRLQHAGLVPHGISAAHAWVRRHRIEGTYQDWALVQREWSMLTGAVFATRRAALEEVDGFDEIFSLEFNDVDLCMRLRMLGYRIVYNPDAELVHAEKASRGEAPPPGDELARFLARWRDWLDHDPSWHRHLRRDRVDVTPHVEEGAWYF